MKCYICEVDKLSKEFWVQDVSPDCSHPPIHCLQCIIDKYGKLSVSDHDVACPHEGCSGRVPNPKAVADDCQTELDLLYPPVQSSTDNKQQLELSKSDADKVVNVVMLTGDSARIPFIPQMTIEQLKIEIEKKLKVQPDKQQLTYNEKVLEEFTSDGNIVRLQDCGVEAYGTIQLMVLMYAIPSHFNHVIFDLFWGYPPHGCDYLDASCLTFCGKTHHAITDYCHMEVPGAIRHSGDVMDDKNRKGHHTIEVHLKEIPAKVTHLYFTLSAWNSPTIAHFPNPSLKFFEASNKTKDLCKTEFTHARNSQAVIMCSVVRQGSQWKIFECGQLSAGNAMDYTQLKSTIQALIKV